MAGRAQGPPGGLELQTRRGRAQPPEAAGPFCLGFSQGPPECGGLSLPVHRDFSGGWQGGGGRDPFRACVCVYDVTCISQASGGRPTCQAASLFSSPEQGHGMRSSLCVPQEGHRSVLATTSPSACHHPVAALSPSPGDPFQNASDSWVTNELIPWFGPSPGRLSCACPSEEQPGEGPGAWGLPDPPG